MTMTPEHIEELEQLARNAAPAPWQECGAERGGCTCGQVWSRPADAIVACTHLSREHYGETCGTNADARFIAAARSALPALCQEWRRLQMELKEQNDAYRVALREGEVMNEMIERLQAENESLRLSQNDTPPQ